LLSSCSIKSLSILSNCWRGIYDAVLNYLALWEFKKEEELEELLNILAESDLCFWEEESLKLKDI
jgi:hypothetical protein